MLKHIHKILLLCYLCVSTPTFSLEEKPFVVVIPSYNNKDWYACNLMSVLTQNYHNFRVIYIDDASPDGTGELVKNYIQENGAEDKVTFIQNEGRRGSLANIYQGIWLCEPHEIVANLDGDDWFEHENVLAKLNEVYADPDVWVTYGQFIYWPSGAPGWAAEVPADVIAENAFRDNNWTTTALRSFYAGLFHKIQLDDFLFQGAFLPMTGDLAYMWPVVEMAGFHSRFISDVLYVYNKASSLNDDKINRQMQLYLGHMLRQKPRYQPVEKPYD